MRRSLLVALWLAACGIDPTGSDPAVTATADAGTGSSTPADAAGPDAAGEPWVEGFPVGISDSDDVTFTHPAWASLNVRRARVVVPYDVAQRPADDDRRDRFERWLAAATAAGVETYVTFGPSDRNRREDGQLLAPTEEEYRAAFTAFRETYPDQVLIGAWNEPNINVTSGGPVLRSGRGLSDPDCPVETLEQCGPMLAAFYWRLVHSICPETICTAVAGEFDSTPDDRRYWDAYRTYLRSHRPAVWSVHPHIDANRFQAGEHHCVAGDPRCSTRTFIEWLDGLDATWAAHEVWLTEVGAYRRNADGVVFSEESQRDATAFILRLPGISPSITRIYYYNFQNGCQTAERCAVQDRGLVSPAPTDGSSVDYDTADRTRSAFSVIAERAAASR